jgi:nitrate reductase assembly molybdenum cofactor insertion protein NarJ
MTDTGLNDVALDLVREAGEWHLLGLLLQCPTPGWRERVRELQANTADAELRRVAQDAITEASEPLYHTTLGPGGPAAPREVSYRRHLQPGQFLAQLATIYEAFAYHPVLDEPLDHVASEVGFVGYLRFKEAYAHCAQQPESAAACRDAVRRFTEDHLAYLAEPLAASLESSGIVYLAAAAKWLAARVGPAPQHAAAMEELPVLAGDCLEGCAALESTSDEEALS